jgi:hypothetical protein
LRFPASSRGNQPRQHDVYADVHLPGESAIMGMLGY